MTIARNINFISLFSLLFASNVDGDLQGVVRSYIADQLSGRYEKILINVLPNPELKKKTEGYKIFIEPPKRMVGLFVLPVYLSDSKGKRKIEFQVDVRVLDNVLVLKRTITKKECINSEDTYFTERDITNQLIRSNEPIKNINKLINTRAKNFLKKDEVLTAEMLEQIPDVLVNEELVMSAENKNINVELKVKAVQEGNIGEVIKVITPKYKKELKVKIINKKNVEFIR